MAVEGLNLIAGKRLFFTNKVGPFADRLVRTVQHLRTNSNVALTFFLNLKSRTPLRT